MIELVLQKIENTPITISRWVSGFIGILFIRFLFESLSSPTRSGLMPIDSYTLIHYGLFWTTLVLGIIYIVGFCIKNYARAAKMALFGLPIIWIAPILDIVISRGAGFTQSYILDTGSKLGYDFVTFFGPNLTWGATYGVRIEMSIVLLGIGWYIWHETRKKSSVILGIISAYILGFIVGSWPGILYTLSHASGATSAMNDVFNYFGKIIFQSTLSHNTLYEGLSSVSTSRFFEIGFAKLSSQILFIFSCLFSGLLFWNINKEKFLVVTRNMRAERIGSYLLLLFSGAGFAYVNNLNLHIVWTDLVGMFCLILSWIGLWMYAVHTNDIEDVGIDAISNTERPLVKKEMSANDMRETGYLWLAVALIGSWCAGFYPFFMSLVYVFTSHIYSTPPLRLRQFPMVSSFLIGVASLATILAGFFFISGSKQAQAFPMFLAIGIVIMVTLAINVKDMKDIAGDTANGILTVPILFGKSGPRVVAICFALSFLLVPVFLSFYLLYIIAIPAGIIGYKLVTRKPYREEPIFILRFAFFALIAIVYLGIYWIGHIYNMI